MAQRMLGSSGCLVVGMSALVCACSSNGAMAFDAGADGGFVDSPQSQGADGPKGSADAPGDRAVTDAASGPHDAALCDGLGTVGQWQNMTPPSATLMAPYTGVLVVLTDPQVSGHVYLTTSLNGVFSSTDCGANWDNVGTDPNITTQGMNMGAWTAVLDPVDPNTLYINDGYAANGIWKSTDGGHDWKQLVLPADVPSFIEAISGDPWDVSDHQHLVVTFHSPCSAPYTPVCFAETTDGGGSWRVLSFALQDNWGEGALITMLDATHWIYTNNGTYYTSDEGAHWAPIPNSPLAPGVGSSGPVFKTPDGRYYLGSGYGVMSSTDGQNWSLLPSSGYLIDSVIGDGQHLFAIEGFHAPRNDDTGNFLWTASYASPTLWSNGPVSGLPSSLNSGSNSMAYDADHHLLYTTLGAEGVWRLRTY